MCSFPSFQWWCWTLCSGEDKRVITSISFNNKMNHLKYFLFAQSILRKEFFHYFFLLLSIFHIVTFFSEPTVKSSITESLKVSQKQNRYLIAKVIFYPVLFSDFSNFLQYTEKLDTNCLSCQCSVKYRNILKKFVQSYWKFKTISVLLEFTFFGASEFIYVFFKFIIVISYSFSLLYF